MLSVALFQEGGIRSVELGTLMFGYTNPNTGEEIFPNLELVRLAIPRRVYTQSHLDYVAKIICKIAEKPHDYTGYKITYQPRLMRHFTARFEPI